MSEVGYAVLQNDLGGERYTVLILYWHHGIHMEGPGDLQKKSVRLILQLKTEYCQQDTPLVI